MELSRAIAAWYGKHKRALPWRETTDPYIIWLSEVIMQQTRVEQGLPYFLKFVQRYGTVAGLAGASDSEVMKLWQGLGYYNRATNMLATARLVLKECNGVFPSGYKELIRLKGIGPYIAAAVSSFSANEPRAVVDGNVFRVISRLFAVGEPINSGKGKKLFSELADELLDRKRPAIHNQAMMELGALVCRPVNPLCHQCPVSLHCRSLKAGNVGAFPVKVPKSKPRDRFLHYFYIEDKGYTFITQRKGKGIWKDLFELPNVELDKPTTAAQVVNRKAFKELFGDVNGMRAEKIFSTRHQLTHQTIHAGFFRLSATRPIRPRGAFLRVRMPDLHMYAVPRLFDKFLNYLKLHSNL